MRAPVFAPPRLLSLTQGSSDDTPWAARVAFEGIDGLPPASYEVALAQAFAVCRRVCGQVCDADALVAFHDWLDRAVLPLLSPDRHIGSGTSTIPVLREARRREIPFRHLGAGIYQLGWGARARRLNRSSVESDGAIAARLAQDKGLNACLLAEAGLPVPAQWQVRSPADAAAAARRLGWPVVIKPRARDRGEGVTIGVDTAAAAGIAFEAARRWAPDQPVLVEQQIPGTCHRLFLVDGRLLYAVRRLPLGVVGDGQRSIAEIATAEHEAQRRRPWWHRRRVQPVDETARAVLSAQGWREDAVPPVGVFVPLRPFQANQWGGADEDVSDRVHPSILDIAVRATDLLGLSVAGVDLVTTDIAQPWWRTGAGIIEINSMPELGAGPISLARVPAFLETVLPDDGRVPVDVVIGGITAMAVAQERCRRHVAAGRRCALTSHDRTLAADGRERVWPWPGLYRRCRALLLDRSVEALVLCLQTDELLATGLPVDRLTALTVLDEPLLVTQGDPDSRRQALVALLDGMASAAGRAARKSA